MRYAWLLALAACYSPHAETGAPCTPTSPACPADQVCVTSGSGSFCERPGQPQDAAIDSSVDAPPDGPSDDRDGDGVVNAADNCPDVANPDQGDEDTDTVGDACDPCPPSADNTDDDNDGVANDCDPHPMIAGDHIALFEGFHQGKPATWKFIGTWTANGDDLVGTSRGYINATLPGFSTHETVAAGATITSVTGTSYRTAGVFDNATFTCNTTNYSTICGMMLTSSTDSQPNTEIVDLYRNPAGSGIDRTALPWSVDDEFVVVMSRTDSDYGCFGYDFNTMGSATAAGTATTDNGVANIGLHVGAATARYHWFMVVTSP
jgi:hypothetical protein